MRKLTFFVMALFMIVSVAGFAFGTDAIKAKATSVNKVESLIKAWRADTGFFNIKIDANTKIILNGRTLSLIQLPTPSNISADVAKQKDGSYLATTVNVTLLQNVTITGTVESIDVEKSQIVVSTKEGEIILCIGEKTALKREDIKIAINDIKIGDEVTALCCRQYDDTFTCINCECREGSRGDDGRGDDSGRGRGRGDGSDGGDRRGGRGDGGDRGGDRGRTRP